MLGRPLGAGEIRRMITAENIVRAYTERKRSTDWAGWASANPTEARLLDQALRASLGVNDGS